MNFGKEGWVGHLTVLITSFSRTQSYVQSGAVPRNKSNVCIDFIAVV